ncbi:MAG TPA: hypothetical protein DCZ95_18625 [Verrucomicrobia bacterium]|nr:MAG: hypothetical protein A2X46_14985 [Lentisphaerae bacterium GWF2_57_35]HBA86104.1 hypothetical protein [Verrucomicrobiota bacterium]
MIIAFVAWSKTSCQIASHFVDSMINKSYRYKPPFSLMPGKGFSHVDAADFEYIHSLEIPCNYTIRKSFENNTMPFLTPS